MSSNTSLTVSTANGGSVIVSIDDLLGSILKSPQVTQVFARAVAHVATSLAVGVVKEVVVVIGGAVNEVKYEMYKQSMTLRIAKMELATTLCADSVANAERQNWPPQMKQELINTLHTLLQQELRALIARI